MTDATPTRPKPRLFAGLMAGIGGFIALVISTVTAIYEIRAKPQVPVIMPGAPTEAGRWIVGVRSAELANQTPDGSKMRDGKLALIVELDLENRTAATSNAYYNVLRLVEPSLGADAKPMLYLKRDGALLAGLNPRMKETVQAVWTLPPGTARPKAVKLSVTAETFKPKDNLYAAPGWFNPHVVGDVVLAVADRDTPTL